jgi:hypothetical protein
MSINLKLTRDEITPTMQRWGEVMRKDGQAVVLEASRRITREVIAITPPASAGITGRDAFQQGRAAIARDMQKALAPVRLKGKRKERHPDVGVAYRQRRVFRGAGVGARVGRVAKAYVDQRKFNALFKELSGRVGRMASGWAPAARDLKVALPAWISRHGTARGRVLKDLSGPRSRVTVTNFAPEARGNVRVEMARRIKSAMAYARNGMQRNIDFMVLKSAGRVGLKVRRQPLGGALAA